jgi:hypothetical protein
MHRPFAGRMPMRTDIARAPIRPRLENWEEEYRNINEAKYYIELGSQNSFFKTVALERPASFRSHVFY